MRSTLVLNTSYEPLNIVSAHRAMNLVLNGRAVSLDDAPYSFRSAQGEFSVPYVILLTSPAPHRNTYKKKNSRVPFSRRGVLVRDNFICAYCGEKGANTFDHILPRALGGVSSWENCVAACVKCNSKKGSKTLAELGWKLRNKPVVPDREPVWNTPWYLRVLEKSNMSDPARASWVKFIGLYDERVLVA